MDLINQVSDYKVVHGFNAIALSQAVNELIEDGWMLYGTPFTNNGINQAMVKLVRKAIK